MNFRRLLLLILAFGLGLIGTHLVAQSMCQLGIESRCIRILFIGNSHTFTNDLPHMIAELAHSDGQNIAVVTVAEGGWKLEDHIHSSRTLEMIEAEQWDYVVLQEQGILPASIQFRRDSMYPAIRQLTQQIRKRNATPLLFETWTRLAGWPEQNITNYDQLQTQVNQAYLTIAQELDITVVPVGAVWQQVKSKEPQLELWQADGNHATEQGTYLAACVFYRTIFQKSPQNADFTADLPAKMAQTLQKWATQLVPIHVK